MNSRPTPLQHYTDQMKIALHDELVRALDLATATVELHTGNGAQSQPGWPLDAHGNIDYKAVARSCRAVLAKAKGSA